MTTQPANRMALIDSGLGGLSVWREIMKLRTDISTLYVADQRHVPYGPRPLEEIQGFARAITEALIAQSVSVIVLASNTTSAAALYPLREQFPVQHFVGMEPALKPAIENTRTGVVAILATPGTFQGKPFARLMERFAGEICVLTQPCPGWVQAVEAGALDSEETLHLVARYVQPLIEKGADQLVLGCTHYPFLEPLIREVAGDHVSIIDPSMAVARQTLRIIEEFNLKLDRNATHSFYTTQSTLPLPEYLNTILFPFSFQSTHLSTWNHGIFEL